MADGGKDGIIIGASSIGQLENNITDLEKGPLPEDVIQSVLVRVHDFGAGVFLHFDRLYLHNHLTKSLYFYIK